MKTNPNEAEPRRHLLGEELSALRDWLVAGGQAPYRADQISAWIYAKNADAFSQMTNVSKSLRLWLAEHADIARARLAAESTARDGTRKLLLTWPDGQSVETVWIPDGERNTACVSTQVGCPVGCRFCASGLSGLQRNLTAGEIVEQAWRIRRLIGSAGVDADGSHPPRLTNVVLMGIGEPLANYDAVVKAIRIMNASWGLGIGARKITLSTVGLPVQIRRLADEGLQLNLALSLHAADDELRRELIPWGRVPIAEVLAACVYYFERTGREVTLEYVLLDGVNTEQRHAAQLARIARRLRCNINLLRYNPVPGLPYGRPSATAAYAFQRELRARGVNAHIRTSRGSDVEAACGQLRRRETPPRQKAGPA
ncbi:MAG: 23S rRNA (adenine(2503)-C(2))-methyltransferase RlmN [Phycisphaerae bacterium]|nr:23S rRNA (adenine(2503)-C(2))-methyltransferase RlmN [Phycisphaerae bacterium]